MIADWLATLEPETVRYLGFFGGIAIARFVMALDPPPGGWT